MLGQFGVEEDRVKLDWVSASEGERFASLVNEMTDKIRGLGPLGFNNGGGKTAE